jgi:sec-independent protein translocase protein TatB
MNLGFPEMLFIFVLALIIFGPKKLPEMGKQIGKALAEFKRASNQFKAQLDVEMQDLERQAAKQTPPPAPRLAPPANTIAQDLNIPPAPATAVDASVDSVFPDPAADLPETPDSTTAMNDGAPASPAAVTNSVEAPAPPAAAPSRSEAKAADA